MLLETVATVLQKSSAIQGHRASDAAQIEDLHAPDPVLVLRAQGESKDPRLHVPLRLPSAAFLGLSLLVSLPFKDCDFKM